MKKIAVFGAGGCGREVKMLIEQINHVEEKFEIIGFFDDGIEKNTIVNKLHVLGGVKELNEWKSELGVICAIAAPLVKKKIIEKINNPYIYFPNVIHPSVCIDKETVEIGQGVIICANCIITIDIKIEDHVFINYCTTVGHDSCIKKYSSIMPSVNISGDVTLEDGVYIGVGAKINNQVKLGEYSIIGSGAVVAKDIPAKCTAVGIPAKPIKFH